MALARHLHDRFDGALFDSVLFDTDDAGFFMRGRRRRNSGHSDYTNPKRFQEASNHNNHKLPKE